MDYHSYNLGVIKNKLKASYVAFQKSKNIYHLKVVKDGNPRYFILQGTPDDVTEQRYKELLELLEKTYGSL